MGSSLVVGLDLGQVHDYSALAVVERVQVFPVGESPGIQSIGGPPPQQVVWSEWGRGGGRDELHVRHLQRWPLGTAYDVIVDDVAALMRTDELFDSWLVFDATGVGRGVKDMFMTAYRDQRMGGKWPLPRTITGEGGSTGSSVAKRDLMSVLMVALQQDGLKISQELELARALQEELKAFRLKISKAGRDSYEFVRREGLGHGDLTIAVGLAAWLAHGRHVPARPVEMDPDGGVES